MWPCYFLIMDVTIVGLASRAAPGINTDTRTLPVWYDLQEYWHCMGTGPGSDLRVPGSLTLRSGIR
jgi:hypothetical protein